MVLEFEICCGEENTIRGMIGVFRHEEFYPNSDVQYKLDERAGRSTKEGNGC